MFFGLDFVAPSLVPIQARCGQRGAVSSSNTGVLGQVEMHQVESDLWCEVAVRQRGCRVVKVVLGITISFVLFLLFGTTTHFGPPASG